MEEKDDLEKLDDQINDLKKIQDDTIKEEKLEEVIEENLEDESEEVTKKIDKIEDVDSLEEDFKTEDENNQDVKSIEEEKEEEKPLEEDKDLERVTKKKKNPFIFIIPILLLIIIIIVIIMLLPKKDNKTKKTTDEETFTKSEQKEIIRKFGDALKGVIALYVEKKDVLLEYEDAVKLVDFDYKVVCKEHEIYDDGELYLNKCTINKYKSSLSYGKKQEKKELKISEDAIKVYVSKTNKKATLKEPSNKDSYQLYGVEIKEAYTDLMLLGDDSDYLYYTSENYIGNMVNYKTGKRALEGINYETILPIKLKSGYDSNYAAVSIDSKWGVFNLVDGSQAVSTIFDSVGFATYSTTGPLPYVRGLGDGLICTYLFNRSDYSSKYGLYDYKKGYYVIADNKKEMRLSGDYIWAVIDYGSGHGSGCIYDLNGKEIFKNKYTSLLGIVDGKYILVNDNGKVKMIDTNGNEYYNYGQLGLYKVSNFGMSYNNGALFQFTNPKKDVPNPDYDGKTDCIELIYDPSTKKGEYKETGCGGIAKPVLYLYPEKVTKVNVGFNHPEYLETTYPKFKDKWEVTAYPNGDLYDKDNKYYYALYWDEAKVHTVDFSEGFYVEDKEAIKFLEEKLDIIGLNPREKNEFIMYWLPILEKNKRNLVYFELTNERESVNKLLIDPKPDSLLRIVIHIKKVDKKIKIKEEKLESFERSGFTAVEWGGTTY